MSFENLKSTRVLRAVAIIVVAGIVLSFGTCNCFVVSELLPDVPSDPDTSFSEQVDEIQAREEELIDEIYADPPSTLNIMIAIQLLVVIGLSYWQTAWAVQVADSAPQSMGYAVAITLGVLLTYGFVVIAIPAHAMIKFLFAFGLIAVNIRAGQIAWGKIDEDAAPQPEPSDVSSASAAPGFTVSAPASGNPQIYYNMGVQAALGGRMDEARQHFKHVLQMHPRHIPAWLQLANLAATPEEAWNYVQQARGIDPNDPAVAEAVNVIWPKVAARAESPRPAESPADAPPDKSPDTPESGELPPEGNDADEA